MKKYICLLVSLILLYGAIGNVPVAMAETLATSKKSIMHQVDSNLTAMDFEGSELLRAVTQSSVMDTQQGTQAIAQQSEDEQALALTDDTYNAVIEASRNLLNLNEEQLKYYLNLGYQLQKTFEEEQSDAFMRDETELSNAIIAMEDMLTVLNAKDDGTLDVLPQTGKENSWRYQNGEKIENETQDPLQSVMPFSIGNYHGIDVSHHQGVIDWESVKKSGIDFVIIRCGFGMDMESQDDKQWARNASECERLGIPYGVYLYSYATSVEAAASEAQHTLRLLKGYSPSLPIFYDLEENRTAIAGNETLGKIAKTYCDTLQQNGYQVGIYASLNWWNNYLTADAFQNENWFRWIAEWRSACSYGGRYDMWQYTNSGNLPGIAGNVDMNYWYGSSLFVQSVLQQEKAYSAVYDYQYYVDKNPDLSGLDRMQAIEHFINQGMKEGRQANEAFNPHIYKQNYKDLQDVYKDDIVQYYYHYMYAGKAEGREGKILLNPAGITVYNGVDYASVYNFTYYVQNNPDVYDYFQGDIYQILAHFVNQGMKEGRQGSEEFNPYVYRKNYADLRATYGDNIREYYIHYVYAGKSEGRKGNEAVKREPITIYNGLDYSPVYDFEFYSQNNPDVVEYYSGDDYAILEHFVFYGMSESRQGNASFNVQFYCSNYADLREAYADDLPSYYLHYIYAGKAEGRIANTLI